MTETKDTGKGLSRKATMKSQVYKVGEHEWLDPEKPKCTADEYFKDISYIVKLNGIFYSHLP